MSKIDSIKSAGAGAASFAKHVIGGAAVGGAVNTAAYANGGALTNSQTAGQAFMSGAGWGAAIGGGFGVGGYKRAMAASARAKAGGAEAGTIERGKTAVGKVASKVKGFFHAQDDMSTSLVNNRKSAHAMAIQEDINRVHGEALDMNRVSKIAGTDTGPGGNSTMFVDSAGVASPAMYRSRAGLPPPSRAPKPPLSRAGASDSGFSGNIYDQN